MKNIIKIAIIGLSLVGLTINAQTNSVSTENKKDYGSWELTLGGGGITLDNQTEFGLDFSLSTNPFEKLPNLWLGIAQGFAWEPKFAGSTDFFADWTTHIYKELYVNTGWSVGAVYGIESSIVWRTGPEVTFEYYVGDSSFIYAGVNYDITSRDKNDFRYSFGIGMTF
jgi:hypothetical protein